MCAKETIESLEYIVRFCLISINECRSFIKDFPNDPSLHFDEEHHRKLFENSLDKLD
jgi:hypothetical protein